MSIKPSRRRTLNLKTSQCRFCKLADKAKIWRVLADLNEIELSDSVIVENVKSHPNLVGRDIKQLLKLAVLHVAKEGKKITPKVIDFVAQFQPTIVDSTQ